MLAYYAIPLYITLIVIEAIYSRWHERKGRVHEGYELKDTAASLAMGIGSVLIGLATAFIDIGLLELIHSYRIFDLGMTWWVFVLLFFGEDFCYYWFHRMGHEMRWMWASHVNHHSSEHYNLSTALRQSWTTALTVLFFWWPLALLGVPVELIMLQRSVSLMYQFWIHTEYIGKLGPLEWILNTPSHHRVHHASDLKYLDANYAGILIIWDRMFGTFVPEQERPKYGLIHNIKTFNPVKIAFHEWGDMFRDVWSAPTFSARLRYIFGSPGWSHDGRKLTVKQMRAAEAAELEEAAREDEPAKETVTTPKHPAPAPT